MLALVAVGIKADAGHQYSTIFFWTRPTLIKPKASVQPGQAAGVKGK
jgi:hypothetical protein